ncbi:DNA helicase [Tenacibaculum litoreum]|uniref:UvrD-helicase domain-containing protein n=1 Tax=Tenacibaculum litoreum TaxID=321269 RepID=UPI0038965A37
MNEKFYNDQKLIQSDESQWSAYNSKGNTVVIAGPGSGKTRVLTLKAIRLLQSDIHHPSGLACISYSRETVRELKKRLKEYGYRSRGNDFIGTMHGFCLIHILQPFAHLFPQYNVPAPMKIASDELTWEIYTGVLDELKIETNQLSRIVLNRQRSLSFRGTSEVEIQTNAFEVEAAELYEKKLSESGHVDFISMVNISTQMIREQDYIKQSLEAKFPWLLIDEYQDLGKALHEMVLELEALTDIKIFAVGDMNQSIYGFNGAYPDFLEELDSKDDFESIPLTSNYRSNQDIIEGSLDMLTINPPRPEYSAKKRVDEEAEFTFIICEAEMGPQYEIVAQKVIPKLKEKGISYSEIGILVACSKDVVQMATSLNDNNIPFYIVKWDFVNSDVVFWLQECAQWCLDSKLQSFDELFRFWQLQLKVHEHERALWEAIRQRVFFHRILIESKTKTTVLEWLEFILSELDLKDLLNNSDRYPDENDNLDALLNESQNRNLKDSPLRRFAFLGEPENEVTVTTRHSAKGLEFEAVIMLGMEEGRFPYTYKVEEGSRQMQEAHRLCYVSVSRAKRECYLLRSKKHTLIKRDGGTWLKDFAPSRFWNLLYNRFGNNNNLYNSSEY